MLARAQNGGSSPTEDKIWENTSPTSTLAGSSTPKNLISGKKLSDYDAIKVMWRLSTTESDSFYIIVPLEQWKSSPLNNQRFLIGGNYVGTGILGRYFTYSSDTAIIIGDCQQMNVVNTQNAKMIPTFIYGIKY